MGGARKLSDLSSGRVVLRKLVSDGSDAVFELADRARWAFCADRVTCLVRSAAMVREVVRKAGFRIRAAHRLGGFIGDRGCAISVRSLNEFANVARCTLGMSWGDIHLGVSSIRRRCPLVLPAKVKTQADALRIAERYGYTIFDALIVASTLLAQSAVLWSEDMQDGVVMDDRRRIVTPFLDRN